MHSSEHLQPQTARIEIYSFETLTLTDKQFLTQSQDRSVARIGAELSFRGTCLFIQRTNTTYLEDEQVSERPIRISHADVQLTGYTRARR
jgi:hypothetical protein